MGLEKVPAEFDRRTGSIIYDTIASAANPLLYVAMEGAQIEDATYIETTYGEYADMLVAGKAITRYPATKAIKKGRFTTEKGAAIGIANGTRFSAVDSADGLIFSVVGPMDTPGEYMLECETAGTVGNSYYGPLIPISYIGVFLTFYWFKLNFDQGGFASFVLLCGITVNASIYILNEYNQIRQRKPLMSPYKAYLKAWNAKITPIFLTVVSTILGFIPFMLGPDKEAFWFPLAAGTIGGLVMSILGIFLYLPLFTLKKQP